MSRTWFYCPKNKCIVPFACNECDCDADDIIVSTNNTEENPNE